MGSLTVAASQAPRLDSKLSRSATRTSPYELFLQLEDIEHRTTKVRRPQSNDIIERFHRTVLDEHLRINGRETWYESVEQMPADLDAYLLHYNTKRPDQGRNMNGRTPLQAS